MAFLLLLKSGQEIPLEGSRLVLGRHPDCDIKLEDGSVSREHAQMLRIDGRYYIEDLQSRNGTFVNDRPISARYLLEDDDHLKICDLEFTYHSGRPGEKTPFAPPPLVPRTTDDGKWTMVEDPPELSSSTVLTKLDLSTTDNTLRSLVRPEVKLRAMIEIAHNLSRAVAIEEVLQNTLDSLFKIFVQADRGFVAFCDGPGKPVIPKAVKDRRGEGETIRISRTIVERVIGAKEAILSADAASDTRFDMAQSIADFRIRSMMCAPLIDSGGTVLGVIQVDTNDQRARFQQEDLDVLASVAQQVALNIENTRLHKMAAEKSRIERDLALAHEVQQGFLPSDEPDFIGFEFFEFYEAAQQLGGDYYDYIALPNQRLAVVLADVSGKGVPAALLMAKLSAEVRFLLASEANPAAAVTRLNRHLTKRSWEDRFVTMVLIVVDAKDNQMTVVNAGHMSPLRRSSQGNVEELAPENSGLPLGVDEDWVYEQTELTIHAGDVITLFTDGISEAMNVEGQLFGLERLNEVLASSGPLSVKDLGAKIIDQVRLFVGRRAQSDDMCLACFGRL